MDGPIHPKLPVLQKEWETLRVVVTLESEHRIGRQAGIFIYTVPFPFGRTARHLRVRHGAVPLDRKVFAGEGVIVPQAKYR
ncbi:hypothetical protein [Streptomyces sp. NPDC012825]|uniref:hypothetical protein n=1 Tax=Streptomyces sp. NPDC012825 TaxID=3364851 RepID=UPI0036B0FB8D